MAFLYTRMQQANFDPQLIFQEHVNVEEMALRIFHYQYENNEVYRAYVHALRVPITSVQSIESIPFLPISLFKTHHIVTGKFKPEAIFESSGTTSTINSRHYVKSLDVYEQSFFKTFELFYGNPKNWCIIGLLPSYLERKNASLVYMVQQLITANGHTKSGFYLDDFSKLHHVLQQLETSGQKTLVIGVTFALLNFAEQYPMQLHNTTIMETGGMKGRRKEMLRHEVQTILKNAWGIQAVHSEYGMTELLSQAYSFANGLFRTPPWMKILLRDEEDPLTIKQPNNLEAVRGVVNIIDLANIYSCSFIATDDLGTMHPNGLFEITGRRDNSDLRGCNLLVL